MPWKNSNDFRLDNNYCLEMIMNDDHKFSDSINIQHLSLSEILRKKSIILRIDFNAFEEKEYKKILKKLLFIKVLLVKIGKDFGIVVNGEKIVAYVANFDKNNTLQKDFVSGINAIFYNTRHERYNYIYDTVCEYLDNYFYGKNLCDFKDNKCGEKRNTSSTIGCCHHFKYKALGPISKLVPCEYLNKVNYTCDAKCLSCKLFTCDYLKSKGVKFRIKDILLLNVFFNPIQKYFIKYMVYTPKEKILKRLMIL